MTTTQIFQRLRADHERVLAELATIERALEARDGADDALRGLAGLIELLDAQFATHMRFEEESLYPALEALLPETAAVVAPLRAEHVELRGMLEALRPSLASPALAARRAPIGVQLRDLVDLLRIHVRKEDAIVFRLAERVLHPMVLDSFAAALGTSPPPAPAAPTPFTGEPR